MIINNSNKALTTAQKALAYKNALAYKRTSAKEQVSSVKYKTDQSFVNNIKPLDEIHTSVALKKAQKVVQEKKAATAAPSKTTTGLKGAPAPPKKVKKPVFDLKKPVAPGKMIFRPPVYANPKGKPPRYPGLAPRFDTISQSSVTKFEYLYGIKNIDIKHMQYENKSVYVSTPIKIDGNVMQVALHSIEEHPLFDELSGAATNRQTSVEYYVASVGANPNPTLDDWLPILPEDEKTVRSELLIFNTARTAKLRFVALIGSTEKAVVYKNGLAIDDDDWSFANGGATVQFFVEKDPTAIYTIDYTPNSEFYNPWLIDIHQRDGRPTKHVQAFPEGTNHNKTVVLDKYPYVNYEIINSTESYDSNTSGYSPFKVTLQDAGIAGPNRTTYREVLPYTGEADQKVFTKNTTNYKTGVQEKLKNYSIDPDTGLYNGFEYYQEGDKLFFSETFNKADIYTNTKESHGNANIVVEYEYLSSDFRLKIILRRNTSDENTLTPIVHEYALKFKVMK